MDVRPDNLFERMALLLNLGPLPAVHAFYGMAASQVVMLGAELGLYAQLAERPAFPTELAERCGISPAITAHVLHCLSALKIVRQRGGRYRLTRNAVPWLTPTSPRYMGDFLRFNLLQWQWWSQLEGVARGERSFVGLHQMPESDPRWATYGRAMFQLARMAAPEIVRAIPVPKGGTQLLDVGGGHGFFASEMCQRHSTLRATIYDLPGANRAGQRVLEDHAPGRNLSRMDGNVLTDELPGHNDVILCIQLLHHLSADSIPAVLNKLRRALNPGGTLAIVDVFSDKRSAGSEAFVSLHHYLVSGTAALPFIAFKQGLVRAGFRTLRHKAIRRMPGHWLLVSR